MAGLPQVPLHSEMVDVAGTKIEVRTLSRAEQVSLIDLADNVDAAEIAMLALTTGFSEDEIRRWRQETPADVVGRLVDEAARISGMTEGASKRRGAGVPAGSG